MPKGIASKRCTGEFKQMVVETMMREKIGGKKHVTIEVYFTYVWKIRIQLVTPELPAETEKPA